MTTVCYFVDGGLSEVEYSHRFVFLKSFARPEDLDMADTGLNAKIVRQVEVNNYFCSFFVKYYFGDINLSKDTFMKKTLEEKDGCKPNF